MGNSREENIRNAIKTYGPITDRFILRLGKSEEEAGKFESWHSNPSTFEEDFKGYLACLALTRLVDSVEERMKSQKNNIRAVKKEQRDTAKTIAKEQAKLQKAIDKAAAKAAKEIEKAKIKAEAKAERERLKLAKKGIPCTSSESTMSTENQNWDLKSDTTIQKEFGTQRNGLVPNNTELLPEVQLGNSCTTSTEATKCTSISKQNQTYGQLDTTTRTQENSSQSQTTAAPEMQHGESITLTEETMKPAQLDQKPSSGLIFETEAPITPTFRLPME
jgi:hypothetical protein